MPFTYVTFLDSPYQDKQNKHVLSLLSMYNESTIINLYLMLDPYISGLLLHMMYF
jgi:hypothetical protein